MEQEVQPGKFALSSVSMTRNSRSRKWIEIRDERVQDHGVNGDITVTDRVVGTPVGMMTNAYR